MKNEMIERLSQTFKSNSDIMIDKAEKNNSFPLLDKEVNHNTKFLGIEMLSISSRRTSISDEASRSNRNKIDSPKIRFNKMQHKNLTIMLIAVVTFFLICQTPSLILNITEAFKKIDLEELKNQSNGLLSGELSKLFLIINLSFNCTIFYIFSRKFRKELHKSLEMK